jgi:hypothetical protein
VDAARVNLGIARGFARMPTFLKVVSSNLNALLKWKNRRTPFEQ